jgi:hypothetical protein
MVRMSVIYIFFFRKLLQKMDFADIFHIDCPFKIIIYGFPLVVFGMTDVALKFDPIAFMVISHGIEEDFTFSYKSFKRFVDEQCLIFQPEFIVHDGALAIRLCSHRIGLHQRKVSS